MSKFTGKIPPLRSKPSQTSESLSTQKSGQIRTHAHVGVGRPRGKRSDPNYTQVTAWVRKDTYNQVGAVLLLKQDRKQFSELVQELLEQWLEKLDGKKN